MKFGIIQERKNPPDKRVVLPPALCQTVMETYPEAQLVVEPSSIRVFTDQEYLDAGVPVQDAMESCDVLLGVKEVPINALLPNKKYFFFSHTIKKQPYNRDLLRAILDKNIELYDHEVITNTQGQRLVAFGRYAGIVGAYNGIRAFGLKEQSFNLPKAENLKDQAALITELKKITLPAIKIVLTGMGRVGNGAKEMLDGMGIKEVSVADYLIKEYQEAVYCQIDVLDYNKPKDGSDGDKQAFFNDPSGYESNFFRFAKVSNMFIAGHFYGDGAPYLFTREDAKHPDFKIKVVADISCDIDGPVASTIKPSTIAEPIYGYDAQTEKEVDFLHKDAIAVMAVDNLPAELPRDASGGFGEAFMTHVIPAFFNNDKDGILERARMTKGGQLTQRYQYLADYVLG
ncbi:NAD(P)-dependent oxidoreductase [Croceivirga sp. JEA036]|uniref:NAD(P)-dependent oxidoreductase n=1 Tax=Croceivirga sp. JEA036 TaxID=2721162 RepID=UPI00143C007D|nr:NAD(P)-dependent oxidoreductase [Croceivirga sp. JEA036]NJB37333.1 alanine dehydrogenase [Croceivirga sp. JEA036]